MVVTDGRESSPGSPKLSTGSDEILIHRTKLQPIPEESFVRKNVLKDQIRDITMYITERDGERTLALKYGNRRSSYFHLAMEESTIRDACLIPNGSELPRVAVILQTHGTLVSTQFKTVTQPICGLHIYEIQLLESKLDMTRICTEEGPFLNVFRVQDDIYTAGASKFDGLHIEVEIRKMKRTPAGVFVITGLLSKGHTQWFVTASRSDGTPQIMCAMAESNPAGPKRLSAMAESNPAGPKRLRVRSLDGIVRGPAINGKGPYIVLTEFRNNTLMDNVINVRDRTVWSMPAFFQDFELDSSPNTYRKLLDTNTPGPLSICAKLASITVDKILRRPNSKEVSLDRWVYSESRKAALNLSDTILISRAYQCACVEARTYEPLSEVTREPLRQDRTYHTVDVVTREPVRQEMKPLRQEMKPYRQEMKPYRQSMESLLQEMDFTYTTSTGASSAHSRAEPFFLFDFVYKWFGW